MSAMSYGGVGFAGMGASSTVPGWRSGVSQYAPSSSPFEIRQLGGQPAGTTLETISNPQGLWSTRTITSEGSQQPINVQLAPSQQPTTQTAPSQPSSERSWLNPARWILVKMLIQLHNSRPPVQALRLNTPNSSIPPLTKFKLHNKPGTGEQAEREAWRQAENTETYRNNGEARASKSCIADVYVKSSSKHKPFVHPIKHHHIRQRS